MPRTLMFTDIEGSTRLLTQLGDDYPGVLADHRSIVRGSITAHGGTEMDTQGDAFFANFNSATSGVSAAIAIQRGLADRTWPKGARVRVRIGLHTGDPVETEEGFVGIDLHKGARICGTAHGGQIVLSRDTYDHLGGLSSSVRFRDLGSHRLKDIESPVRLHDLEIDGLDCRFPPLRSIGARPTNLPPDLPSLVGRDPLIDEVVTALREGTERLVALVGPGGIGKSSLSLRVGASLLSHTSDGVFVTWLAPLEEAASVPTAIADCLRLRPAVEQETEQLVADYLADRELLLILDNLEQVLDAADFIDDLLTAAPRLRVLITSRVPTRLTRERVIEVPPLAVNTQTGGREDTPAAVDLFIRRARAAGARLRLDEADRAAIEEICRRLDGIPLAIELAAARVRLLPPTVMVDRIRAPLDIAAGGPRSTSSRHQTLRAAIGWSIDLLSEAQQRLLSRLAVFAAPFTLNAAETVCEAELDDLAALLDHHLLRSLETRDGRIGMFETIRAYATELLQSSGEEASFRDRHATWAADLAAAGGPELLCGRHEQLLDRYDAERADLDSAMDWLEQSARWNEALSMAANLAVFCDTRGQLREGRDRLERSLSGSSTPDDILLARALFSVGRLTLQLGDTARALSALEQALPVFARADDARSITLCLSHLGACASRDGDTARADALCRQALAVARASGDPWTIAVGLNNLANELMGADDLDEARDLLEECVSIRRRLGEKRTLAISLGNLGETMLEDGDLAQAERHLGEALAFALEIGFEVIVGDVRRNLAILARHRGEYDRARALLVDALSRAERTADVDLHRLCQRELELLDRQASPSEGGQ